MLTRHIQPRLPTRPLKSRAQTEKGRKHIRKVRTGCKTCKIRKVKCDEAKPICRRCQKADIACDGYKDIPKETQLQDLALAINARYSTRPIFPKYTLDISRSPSTPRHLAVPEQLFFNIERYMSGSFSSCTWVPVDNETCMNIVKGRSGDFPESEGGALHDLILFYNCCSASVELFRKKRFVEGRRAVSQACGLVQTIITAENPLTVEYLLHVFLFLIRGNLPEVVFLLSKHISNMARICFASGHSWAQILQLMGSLDPFHSEEIILEGWKCMNKMYQQGLGQRHSVSLQSELNMVKFCLTGPNLGFAEQHVREIQKRYTKDMALGSTPAFTVFQTLWKILCTQEKHAEAEAAVLEFLSNGGEQLEGEYEVLGFQYLAQSQNEQGKVDLAKRNIVVAIKLTRTRIPPPNPWALRQLLVLQSLWQDWGFGEEPAELEQELEFRMEHGDIDGDDP